MEKTNLIKKIIKEGKFISQHAQEHFGYSVPIANPIVRIYEYKGKLYKIVYEDNCDIRDRKWIATRIEGVEEL